MSDSRLALQKAVYARLTGNASLMAKVSNRVYDFVPQADEDGGPYPFIQLPQMQVEPFDTKTFNGFELRFTVNVWSRPGSIGQAEAHDLNNDIYDLLHKWEPTISGWKVVLFQFEFSDVIVDPDTVTYHGIQRFRIIMAAD